MKTNITMSRIGAKVFNANYNAYVFFCKKFDVHFI